MQIERRKHVLRRAVSESRVLSGVVAIALLLLGTASTAQNSEDSRFIALSALAESKMREYGVPGLALGIYLERGAYDWVYDREPIVWPLPASTVDGVRPDFSNRSLSANVGA